MRILLISLAVIILLVFAPLATIWALNTLFHLNIPFTAKTWLAMFVVEGALYSKTSHSNK